MLRKGHKEEGGGGGNKLQDFIHTCQPMNLCTMFCVRSCIDESHGHLIFYVRVTLIYFTHLRFKRKYMLKMCDKTAETDHVRTCSLSLSH